MLFRLSELKGEELSWVQPSLNREYDLVGEGKAFGKVRFLSKFGSLAIASLEEGNYTLKRQGFLQPSVSVRKEGTEIEHGKLNLSGWHQSGVLTIEGHRVYQFLKMGFLHPEWGFIDPTGKVIARMRMVWGVKYHADVHLERSLKDDKDLPILLLVGIYTIILMIEEASAASAATVTQ